MTIDYEHDLANGSKTDGTQTEIMMVDCRQQNIEILSFLENLSYVNILLIC